MTQINSLFGRVRGMLRGAKGRDVAHAGHGDGFEPSTGLGDVVVTTDAITADDLSCDTVNRHAGYASSKAIADAKATENKALQSETKDAMRMLARFLNPRTRSNMEVGEDVFVPGAKAGPTYDRFAEYLPWVGYIEDMRLFVLAGREPGSYEGVAFALEVTPQIGATPELASAMSDFATMGAPVGTGIQVSMFGAPDIDYFTEQWVQSTVDPATQTEGSESEHQARILRAMAQEYASFMQQATIEPMGSGIAMRARNFRCVLSVVIPTKEPSSEKTLQMVRTLRGQMIQKLRNFWMFDHEWDATDALRWLDMLMNPHQMFTHDRPHVEYDPGREIRHQVVRTDTHIEIAENQINFTSAGRSDTICARAFSVRSYPGKSTLHAMKGLLGSMRSNAINFPCPFVFTAGVQLQDFDSEKGRITAKALRAQQTAESQMAKMLPGAQEINEDYKVALRSFDTSKGTCKMYHELVVYARPNDIDAAHQAAVAVFRDQQWEIGPDSLHHCLGLVASMPMSFGKGLQGDMKRMWKLSTKTGYNVGNLLPLVAEFRGTPLRERASMHMPQYMLLSRNGQPRFFDIFANPSGNYNGAIVGKSGSGKSFAANQLVLRMRATGGRVWIIDVGGSYKKLCELLKGQYIQFSERSNISLNPFSMVGEDLNEDLEVITPVLEMMASPGQPLTPYLRAQLETTVKDIWATILDYGVDPREVMTVTMVSEGLRMNCALGGGSQLFQARLHNMIRGFLQRKGYEVGPALKEADFEASHNAAQCDPAVREMGVSLGRFSEDGAYGRWFEEPANISFTSSFVVLELEELNSKPALRAVVLMLLMQSITRTMYLSDRKTPMLCLIDEAWDLLKSEGAGAFIEAGYRRARKYKGAFWTATQSVQDYYQSDTAQAAWANADWTLLLSQKKESIQQLERSQNMFIDEQTREDLMGLTTSSGQYSEIWVKAGDLPGTVGRLFADPFTALVSSSKAEDVAAVSALVEQGMPIEDAIRTVLRQRQSKQRKENA